MKTKLRSFFTKLLLAVVLLFVAKTTSFAAFPPVLVIGGTAYPGTEVDGSGGDTYFKYTTNNSVLLLHGATGGVTAIGADETSALNSPTTTGTWDGGMHVYLTGTTVIVPQVLVYYPATVTPAAMLGYDGAQHQAAGSGSVNGKFVVAYNGLPNGYIFNFGTGQPVYRYQAGTSPVSIDTTNGWPPPNVFIFPSQVTYSGETLSVTSYTNGILNGYWANAYYATTDGTNIYCQLHAYIAPDGSGGQLYGDVGGTSVSAQWDSTTQTFVASPSLGVGFDSPSNAPAVGSAHYGPPQVEVYGTLLPFAFSDINGSDVYWNQSAGIWMIVDGSNAATTSWGASGYCYYDSIYLGQQSSDNIAAVSADGTSFIGNLGPGITIYNETSLSNLLYTNSSYSSFGYGYYFTEPNGRIVQFIPTYGIGVSPFALQGSYSTSPLYTNQGYSSSKYLDATNGWPTGDILFPNITKIYFNGQEFDAPNGLFNNNGNPFESGGWVSAPNISMGFNEYPLFLGDTNYFVTFQFGNDPALPDTFIVDSSVLNAGAGFARSSDGGDVYVSCAQQDSPQNGPVRVFWNGISYPFAGTISGTDNYVNFSTGDEVSIDSTDHVTAGSSSGTYNPSTSQFSITGMVAQDSDGNLLGTPPGLIINFTGYPGDTSESGPGGTYGQGGQAIQLGNGTIRNSSNSTVYTVARNDGTWFVKYIGIPQGCLFVIKDYSGAYSSPVYTYSNAYGNNYVVDTTPTSDWPTPSSSIYPSTLYINGQLATLDSSAELDWTTGGYITYHVQPDTGDSIDITWNWNNGFSATTDGTFLAYNWSSGTWDGSLFGGLPSDLIISAQAPPQTARFGPLQIVWNGVQLTLDSLASSTYAGNPNGSDIYHDSLGLSLQVVVASDGTVSVHQSDGTVLTGTYNGSTHQFQFSGNAVGSLKAANNQGFVYSSSGETTPVLTQDTNDIAGNLDIHGNLLTFGNWTDSSGNSINAFCLAYVNGPSGQQSLLNFSATRQSTEWVWSHAATDQGDAQVTSMVLSPTHALQLYSPANATAPAIILDPGGNSHIEPQGDLPMGQFTQQPQQ